MSLIKSVNDDKKENPLDNALSIAINSLTIALLKETYNVGKREVKPIALLNQNRFIFRIIKDYLPLKKQQNNEFEKSIQKAISQFALAINNRNENQMNMDNQSNWKFWKRS